MNRIKRLLAALLVLIMVFGMAGFTNVTAKQSAGKTEKKESQAPENGFRWEQLSDQEGFTYVEEENRWFWETRYAVSFDDAGIKLAIALRADGGSALNGMVLALHCDGYDVPAQSFDIIIDGDTYSYEKLMYSSANGTSGVVLGQNGKLLIEALAFCDPDSVSARIRYGDAGLLGGGWIEFDLDPALLTKTLKGFCRKYLEVDLWNYCTDPETLKGFCAYEEEYPLTVNGVKADYAAMKKDRDLSEQDHSLAFSSFEFPENPESPYGKALKKNLAEGVHYSDTEKYDLLNETERNRKYYVNGEKRYRSWYWGDNSDTLLPGYRVEMYFADGMLYRAAVSTKHGDSYENDVLLYYWGDQLLTCQDRRRDSMKLGWPGDGIYKTVDAEFGDLYRLILEYYQENGR